MSEMDRKDMEDVLELIGDGYTKVGNLLREKVTVGEVRGFMAGYLSQEKDEDFELIVSTIKEIRDILKSDRHE